MSYTKLGCFIDDKKKPHPLPELMFTDRDTNSRVSSGKTVDWNNWDKYIVDVVCRCAKAASAKEYSHFSIQYYGTVLLLVNNKQHSICFRLQF